MRQWASLTVAAIALAVAVAAVVTSVSLSRQLARERVVIARAETVISAQQAQLSGDHRDLITCGDLQRYSANLQIADGATVYDSLGGSVSIGGISVNAAGWLPAHCINQ